MGALVWLELIEQRAESGIDIFDAAGIGLAQQGLDLGEYLLDRVQIRAVSGQEQQQRTRSTNGRADRLALMAAEVIHDDDIAWPERWHQELPDPGEEADGVDRLSQHTRCDDAVAAQCGDESQCLPMPIWHLGNQALPAGATPVRAGHVGLHPGLIDEDQTLGVNLVLVLFPLLTPACDVGPVLLAGVQAFF
jgi:hypothetical protein